MDGLETRSPIFVPDTDIISGSQMTAYTRFCEQHTARRFATHTAFHRFSAAEYRQFWRLFIEWSDLPIEGDPTTVCTDDRCEHAVFFPDIVLNYADSLLQIRTPDEADRPALTACHDGAPTERLSRRELRDKVARLREGLRHLGIQPGSRVVAVAQNNAETVIACLAVASLGATFSTAAPDMGVPAILSRFDQLGPALLMCNLRSPPADNAALSPLATRIASIASALPTLTAVVALDDGSAPPDLPVPLWRMDEISTDPRDGCWPKFPFNHPLFILFSSGTTGKPKCLVHGAGGTLIEHVKEHRLHCDLRHSDKLLFQTSCAWMMWNWQLSALASGTEIVVYDGPIKAPDTLWQLVAEQQVTVFGTSPPYLQFCETTGFSPRDAFALPRLRAILSTGSILYDRHYDWVRDHVKSLPLQSVSGGTDIIGCFVLGNPNLPVYRGHAQCRTLGYDVQAQGSQDVDGATSVGELICRNPFPSRPLGLYGDLDGRRFHDTYFSQHPGVWTHGDLIQFTADGTARLHGRSDGVLNIRGIRIGPAEIYHILQDIPTIKDALAIEQKMSTCPGGSRMVLLVVLQGSAVLDGDLTRRIKMEIGHRTSPAHVPEVIAQIPALPCTHSGKLSERAAHDAINGVPLKNLEALQNPECLDAIRCHPVLRQSSETPLDCAAVAGEPLEHQLRIIWERLFQVSPIGPDDNFFDLGGHSLLAFILFCEIRKVTGCDLPLSTLLSAPTINSLAALLKGGKAPAFSCLVPLKSKGDRRPLFIVHGLYGNVLDLMRLAVLLPDKRPVYALQARGLDPTQPPHRRVEDMAVHYIDEIRTVQPHGSYALAGHSFGGLVAFEMARRLRNMGEDIGLLALLDTDVNEANLPWRQWLAFQGARMARVSRKAVTLPPRDSLSYLRCVLSDRLPLAKGRTRRHPFAERIREPLPRQFTDVHEAGIEAMKAYRPRLYPGRIEFFRAEVREPQRCDPLPVWRRRAGMVVVTHVTGEHLTMMQEPHISFLAKKLSPLLGS